MGTGISKTAWGQVPGEKRSTHPYKLGLIAGQKVIMKAPLSGGYNKKISYFFLH